MGRERDHRAGQLCSSNPSFMLQQVETQYWLPRQEQKSKFGGEDGESVWEWGRLPRGRVSSEGPRLPGGGLSEDYGQLIQGHRDEQKGLCGLGHSRVASGLLGPVGTRDYSR